MKTIVIKTQKEFDDLPDSFDEYTVIRIESAETIKVTKNRGSSGVVALDSFSVVALDSSSVEVHGSSSVETYDSSRVVAYDSSSVVAYNSSRVLAYNSSRVVARDSSRVEALDSSSVSAYDLSRVSAYDSSRVEAHGSSSVVTYNSSSVEAYDSSRVVAYNSSSVEAYDSSRVVAHGSSSVVTYNSSRVEAHGSSSVVTYNSSSVVAYNSSSVVALDSSRVDLFMAAYVVIYSSSVIVGKLLDYSTAIFKGCPENILEKSDTAFSREVPAYIEVSFEEWLKRGYVVADGIHKKLISQKKIGDVEVFECEEFLEDKSSYVVERGDLFSHGETVEKAIEDLRYKIGDRDTSEFEHWSEDINKEVSIEDAIACYRVVTGACEYGVKQFVESIKVPDELTPSIVLELTKDQYGYDKFRKFLLGERDAKGS